MLDTSNIGVRELADKYILHYKPQPCTDNREIVCLLKGLLLGIRSDTIYNAYNDDFGVRTHSDQAPPEPPPPPGLAQPPGQAPKSKPAINIKLKSSVSYND